MNKTSKALVAVTMILGVACSAPESSAKTRVDDGKGDATFRVEGKLVTAVQAQVAAHQGKTVEKCKVKDTKGDKTFYSEDGTPLGKAVECTKMDYVINPKNGHGSWKKQK